jgi:hypothetical protein
MRSFRRVGRVVWLLVGGVSLSPLLASTARAEGDEHASVQATVDAVARDTEHAAVTAELLERARRELERATRLRLTHDEVRARAADGAAREWADTAVDVLRAVAAETKAGDLRRKALDTQAQVERTRAQVDEDTGRIGRLKAELENAQKDARAGADPDRRAVEVHGGESPPPKKTAKKTAPGKATPAAPTRPGEPTGGTP